MFFLVFNPLVKLGLFKRILTENSERPKRSIHIQLKLKPRGHNKVFITSGIKPMFDLCKNY